MVGLADTVGGLVCCVWRRIVDIHDSGMSIPLSLFSVLGRSRIWIVDIHDSGMSIPLSLFSVLGRSGIWIVDIHDSGMSIPLSLFSVLGRSRIASFTRRLYQCRSLDSTPLC